MLKLNDKPAYVDKCVFDLSKTLIYDFCYSYVKGGWGKKAKQLFLDTDSLVYKIETNNVHEDFYRNKVMF